MSYTLLGLQLLALGVVGEYLAGLTEEVKRRPIYLVAKRYGFRRKNRGKAIDTGGRVLSIPDTAAANNGHAGNAPSQLPAAA